MHQLAVQIETAGSWRPKEQRRILGSPSLAAQLAPSLDAAAVPASRSAAYCEEDRTGLRTSASMFGSTGASAQAPRSFNATPPGALRSGPPTMMRALRLTPASEHGAANPFQLAAARGPDIAWCPLHRLRRASQGAAPWRSRSGGREAAARADRCHRGGGESRGNRCRTLVLRAACDSLLQVKAKGRGDRRPRALCRSTARPRRGSAKATPTPRQKKGGTRPCRRLTDRWRILK